MPTVASDSFSLHLNDIRSTASRSFFLDAEELCNNACLGGLVTSNLPVLKDMGAGKPAGEVIKDCSLLAPSHSQELSPMHSNAAMQFLLLDDDEACTTSSGPTDVMAVPASPSSLHAQDAFVRPPAVPHSFQDMPSMPYVDSTTLYCLAVVDEETGLPLRPATPEETWEVERCFVLQQQCEMLDPFLPEQWQCQITAAEPVALDVVTELQGQQEQQQQPADNEAIDEEEQVEQNEEEVDPLAPPHNSAPAIQPPRRPEQQPRRCGPCDNCGATESPQWRQGPASKPLLCNACGMRFRRTNQLVAGETGTASGARGRAHKKAGSGAAANASASAEPRPRPKAPKAPQALLPMPDAKRPRRAAAVAAAATVAAAIDACS